MRLTKKLMKELHEELWLGWLAKNPKGEKDSWPRWKDNGGDLNSDTECFACDYDDQHHLGPHCKCPLDFPGREDLESHMLGTFDCLGGLYRKWVDSTGKARIAWATIIGTLPLYKEEKRCR